MPRPADLPEFTRPPLVEVVVSVQFESLKGYQQVWARPIWELFKDRFGTVQEQLPLPPTFETFGAPVPPVINFDFIQKPIQTRLWFLNHDQTELLQFQSDRFIHNWRKLPGLNNQYPRFETIIEEFDANIIRLDEFLVANSFGRILPNQCELSYINFIPADKTLDSLAQPDQIFELFQLNERTRPTDFSCDFRYDVHDANGNPYARQLVRIVPSQGPDGQSGIALHIIARGAPADSTCKAAIDLLIRFRELIVWKFVEITTPGAQSLWGKNG